MFINTIYLPICVSMTAASSEVALGMIPGSLKLVLNKAPRTKRNVKAPTTGIQGDSSLAKNGQLWRKKYCSKFIEYWYEVTQ